jgi:hypothetical protein
MPALHYLFQNITNMQLQQASRKNAKIKMAIQGPSGSGKTWGALLVAFGLCADWSKIAVIDTENHSSELYSHLGNFQVLHLEAPFEPERYIEAIKTCEKAGVDVIIVDSISHEWEGIGGILEIHGNMTGNSYTNWNHVTPRHNSFVQNILQSPAHIIGTVRSKQDYVLVEKNNKQVPQKVGLKGVTREGMDYEFTLVLEVDINNNATASKDRTSLFANKPYFKLTTEVGKKILNWCNQGTPINLNPSELTERINDCKSLQELLALYYANPTEEPTLLSSFSNRRVQLENPATQTTLNNTTQNKINGTVTRNTRT